MCVDSGDPGPGLAARLRGLRKNWHLTQKELAHALGRDRPLSESLISSWESKTIPPPERLDDYAALFATSRSVASGEPRLISPDDMTDEELRAMNELQDELRRLRGHAQAAAQRSQTAPRGSPQLVPGQPNRALESLDRGPWRFMDGHDITIVCAQWPPAMRQDIPYTDPDDPDYIRLLTFSELDSLYELNGHLRAANPASEINLRAADQLTSDDYSSHLIILGGIDWNTATRSIWEMLDLPVRQVAEWDVKGEQYFEVANAKRDKFRPALRETDNKKPRLREDVSLFARAPNPLNRKRTVTMCNGMYGQGTYGVVRALTDRSFRDRNIDYLESRFGDTQAYCLLTRVRIVDRATITPDWTENEHILFEWSRTSDASR